MFSTRPPSDSARPTYDSVSFRNKWFTDSSLPVQYISFAALLSIPTKLRWDIVSSYGNTMTDCIPHMTHDTWWWMMMDRWKRPLWKWIGWRSVYSKFWILILKNWERFLGSERSIPILYYYILPYSQENKMSAHVVYMFKLTVESLCMYDFA